MTTTFEPDVNWQRVRSTFDPSAIGDRLIYEPSEGERAVWVRKPVSPLPDKLWTVIRVTWRSSGRTSVFCLVGPGHWSPVSPGASCSPEYLANGISSFEVLAEGVQVA